MLNDQVAGGVTYSPTPTSLFEFRARLVAHQGGQRAAGRRRPDHARAYGITGIPTDPRFAGGLTEQDVTGWTTWGRQNSNPQFQDPSVFNPRINYSWIRGARASRPATSTRRSTRRSTTSTRSTAAIPTAASSPARQTRPADPATYNLADFMFGARSAYSIITPFIANLRQRMHFGYLQDDIKVGPKLTLNLGLRYEYATPQYEKDNFLTNYDPATNTLIQAKDGSIYDRALVNPDRNNFAPRLGVAFAVDDKTVSAPATA